MPKICSTEASPSLSFSLSAAEDSFSFPPFSLSLALPLSSWMKFMMLSMVSVSAAAESFSLPDLSFSPSAFCNFEKKIE